MIFQEYTWTLVNSVAIDNKVLAGVTSFILPCNKVLHGNVILCVYFKVMTDEERKGTDTGVIRWLIYENESREVIDCARDIGTMTRYCASKQQLVLPHLFFVFIFHLLFSFSFASFTQHGSTELVSWILEGGSCYCCYCKCSPLRHQNFQQCYKTTKRQHPFTTRLASFLW